MTDVQSQAPIYAVDWFRVKAREQANSITRRHLAKAIDSFNSFMGGTPVPVDQINEDLLSEWVSWLFYQGLTKSTAQTYLSKLSALFGKAVKEGIAPKSDCFAVILCRLRAISQPQLEINSDPESFAKLRRLVAFNCSGNPQGQLVKDLILFAVYMGGMTFGQLATFKKEDYTGSERAILDIVRRHSRARFKYLFALNQSQRTPAQLDRDLAALFGQGLSWVNINLTTVSTATACDLWAIAAMRCGVSAKTIAACISPEAALNPIFSFAPAAPLEPQQIEDIRRRVVNVLTRDSENWYAMQFRPRVTLGMVEARMKTNALTLAATYYPMEEILRRVGNRKVYEKRPIIPGLLFFKAKASELSALFRAVGDVAWGYRQSRDLRSPYAVISQKDIQTFQTAIGQFDQTTEIFPAGTIELRPGDRLEIIGGNLCGHTATFDSDSSLCGRTIRRLHLLGDNDIEWIVNSDIRLVRKIS